MNKALAVLLELKDCSDPWCEYFVPIGIHERIDEAIQQLLAQPEHIVDVTDMVEPVEERITRWHRLGYEQGKKASQREPLTPQQISEGNQSMLNVTRDAFVKGVKFAEEFHGIGGG